MAGVTVEDILQAADWSGRGVFQRFYYRPKHSTTYGSTVLKTNSSKLHVDIGTEPSEVLYNYRMAQVMQWPQAIWNYMKKVRWTCPTPPTRVKLSWVCCKTLNSCYICIKIGLLCLFVRLVFSDTAQWTEDGKKNKKAEVSEDGGPYIGGWACSFYACAE